MDAVSFVLSYLKNFQLDKSIKAGGFASIITVALGMALVAAGVVIPPISIGGLILVATATPVTQAMVFAAALPIGHLVSAVVPAKLNEQLTALADKLGVSLDHIKSFVPEIEATYPVKMDGTFAQAPIAQTPPNENINKG